MIVRLMRTGRPGLTDYLLREMAQPEIKKSPIPLKNTKPEDRIHIIDEYFLRRLRYQQREKEMLHLVTAYSLDEAPDDGDYMAPIDFIMEALQMPSSVYPQLSVSHYNTPITHQHTICPAYDLSGRTAPALSRLTPKRIKDIKQALSEKFPGILYIEKEQINRAFPKAYLKAHRINQRNDPDKSQVKPFILQFLNVIEYIGKFSKRTSLREAMEELGPDYFVAKLSEQTMKGIKSENHATADFLATKGISMKHSCDIHAAFKLEDTQRILENAFPNSKINLAHPEFWYQSPDKAAKQVRPFVKNLTEALKKKPVRKTAYTDWTPLEKEIQRIKKPFRRMALACTVIDPAPIKAPPLLLTR